MARSQESFNKREKEKQRQKKQQDKKERMNERKNNKEKGSGLDDMMAYLDENGNIVSAPPDPAKKLEIRMEDIAISTPKMEDQPEDDAPRTGVVTFFNHDKGFGFITDQVTNERIFVHMSELTFPAKENDKVAFEIGKGPKGPVAMNVVPNK